MPLRIRAGRHLTKLNLKIPFVVKSFPNQAPEGYAGREAFAAGDYRWVAELVGHLVFADPANLEARALQADAFEQMGFQAESGPWRDFYLTGAQELRYPRPPSATPRRHTRREADERGAASCAGGGLPPPVGRTAASARGGSER